MQKQDLQQISNLLDQKFKENNKKIFKKINGVDEKVEKLLTTVKEEFDKNTEQHNKINEELAKRPTKKEMFSWADKRIVDVELNMDKVKYIHLDEWEKLPPTFEISKTLVEHKLKKKR